MSVIVRATEHDNGAARVLHAVLADRAEQHFGESAVAVVALIARCAHNWAAMSVMPGFMLGE